MTGDLGELLVVDGERVGDADLGAQRVRGCRPARAPGRGRRSARRAWRGGTSRSSGRAAEPVSSASRSSADSCRCTRSRRASRARSSAATGGRRAACATSSTWAATSCSRARDVQPLGEVVRSPAAWPAARRARRRARSASPASSRARPPRPRTARRARRRCRRPTTGRARRRAGPGYGRVGGGEVGLVQQGGGAPGRAAEALQRRPARALPAPSRRRRRRRARRRTRRRAPRASPSPRRRRPEPPPRCAA